ncbi:hypothetical protein BIV57_20925 [Mangrovactinospora gilvigrisea]|uniref:DUF4328 domain-containing protein n=1 Tax=Mangrovactinospora gilvigrisea TaxID=1428644 RepID=A0A1J7C7G2_9ACTN|nr:DUF4328 domain-containing protein [Mangrovactinospora gilvigrisea]OIV35586.1 hypothetical protein BIV57_20925 [Mangrovactinospora gilvigrisea]
MQPTPPQQPFAPQPLPPGYPVRAVPGVPGGMSKAVLAGLLASGVLSAVNVLTMHPHMYTADGAYSVRVQAFTGITGMVPMACIVLFLVWFHQVRNVAEYLAPGLQRRRPGWAIGAWFIPVANLWMPLQVAHDIHAAAHGTRQGPGRGIVNSWWAAWLASVVMGWALGITMVVQMVRAMVQLAHAHAMDDPQLVQDYLMRSIAPPTGLAVAVGAVELAAAGLAAFAVHRITADLGGAMARVQAAQPQAPGAMPPPPPWGQA